MSSTARNELNTREGSGEGECARVGSDSMTHTITATSSRMCSQALVCSWQGGAARRVGRGVSRAACKDVQPGFG